MVKEAQALGTSQTGRLREGVRDGVSSSLPGLGGAVLFARRIRDQSSKSIPLSAA